MNHRITKALMVACVGMMFGFLPGCVEVFLLNIATPFLIGQ